MPGEDLYYKVVKLLVEWVEEESLCWQEYRTISKIFSFGDPKDKSSSTQ